MLTKTYTISCDTPGCTTKPISYSCPAGDVSAPGHVKHLAVEKGWRQEGGAHACPLHIGELRASKPPGSGIHLNTLGVDIGHNWRERNYR